MSEVSDIVGLTAGQATAYAGFDPAVHATNPDGSPRMKKGGGYAMKRGRKSGDPAAATAPRTSTISSANPSDEVRIGNDQAALMLAGMTVGVCTTLLGTEWMVTAATEKKGLVDATRAYLDATGGMDMSPGTALVLSWGGAYAFPRLALPETQSRLARFGSWVKSAVSRKRAAE